MEYCSHNNCKKCCCKSSPLGFESLSDDEREEMFSERKEIHFYPGEVIFKQGSALTHFACFRSGFVKVYIERKGHNPMLIDVIKKGHLCGSMGLFSDSEHHLSYVALTEVSICFIPLKAIEEMLLKNNKMFLSLLYEKEQKINQIINKIANLTNNNTIAKVADVFLFLEHEIYNSNKFTLNLSRQDLADLSFMSKRKFMSSMKEIQDVGVIQVNNKNISILKEDTLLEICH